MPDSNIVLELARQVPSLLVLVWLVWFFLKSQKSRDELIQSMGAQCHIFQRDLDDKADVRNDKISKVIEKNTTTLGQLQGILLNGQFNLPQKTQG